VDGLFVGIHRETECRLVAVLYFLQDETFASRYEMQWKIMEDSRFPSSAKFPAASLWWRMEFRLLVSCGYKDRYTNPTKLHIQFHKIQLCALTGVIVIVSLQLPPLLAQDNSTPWLIRTLVILSSFSIEYTCLFTCHYDMNNIHQKQHSSCW